MSQLRQGLFALAAAFSVVVLPGCPKSSKSSSTGSTAAPAASFDSEKAILQADATQPDVQAALSALALSREARASLRVTALTKLQEQAPNLAVSVAEKLAFSTGQRQDDETLRDRAVGLLVHAKTPEAKAAIEKLKKSSLEAGILAARLERKEAGK